MIAEVSSPARTHSSHDQASPVAGGRDYEQRTKPRPMCGSREHRLAHSADKRDRRDAFRADVARIAGVDRRKLRRDKWPRFDATYERMAKLRAERS